MMELLWGAVIFFGIDILIMIGVYIFYKWFKKKK